MVGQEIGGQLAFEAEHFFRQTHTGIRKWHLVTATVDPSVKPDGDPSHAGDASGGAYLEVLPDTRRTHDDRLIAGENFCNEPGEMAVLHYKVNIQTPGRYYVWVRAYSTGSEDNGLHVGLDGSWPASGRRLQWCDGKNSWRWESKQRTPEQHCGEPFKIYLDIEQPGEHEIQFSMREDGFEFDKWFMSRERLAAVDGKGPDLTALAAESSRELRAALPAADGRGRLEPRRQDGDGSVELSGELKQWHKVTLTLDGPFAHERDEDPNPFTDYRMEVHFRHESGTPSYSVPGYFAADGEAAQSSAESGTQWRAHLSPDKTGRWQYAVSFVQGPSAAIGGAEGEPLAPFDGRSGTFTVEPSDKQGRDFRARGRLEYVGEHHLQFAGSKEYFLKAGADAPETLLAYEDFDGTVATKENVPLKSWSPHIRDWRTGDPTWKGDKGKGLIGALNYLAGKGVNAFSFLPYNAGGDGDNVWPFVARNEKLHYDCSKLDQWAIVFDHATAQGLYLHFKLQENEMDDDRLGASAKPGRVPESLDGGKLGPERKLYCRELIARFAHNLALNWNLGEENTQSTEELRDMAGYIHDTDPYDHLIVVHTFPNQQDKVYPPLLGDQSALRGASLQNGWDQVHRRTLQWIQESEEAGQPWVVANDEQGPANLGVPPDPGYKGFDGVARPRQDAPGYTMHEIRKSTLWGNLMAGGAGVEYYFGYQLPENDLVCEDFRSRDRSWDYCRIALQFFHDNDIPFWEMKNADSLIVDSDQSEGQFCHAKPRELYLVFLPRGGDAGLDLADAPGRWKVRWFNPREGGELRRGSVESVRGGNRVLIGNPPADPDEDWLVVIRQ